MNPNEPYELATPRTTDILHIVSLSAEPGLLILGSPQYDDTERQSLCGAISEFSRAQPTDETADYCLQCVRVAVSQGIIDDHAPFTQLEIETGERSIGQLRAGGGSA